MANKESDMFYVSPEIPSAELLFFDKELHNQIRGLILSAFPPNDTCAPEVRLERQGGRFSICIVNKARADSPLVEKEVGRHRDPTDAFHHLIVQLGTRPAADSARKEQEQGKNHFSPKESPDPAAWRDLTGREARNSAKQMSLRKDITELAAKLYLWYDNKAPVVSVEKSQRHREKVVIHIYDAQGARVLKGKAFKHRREAMDHTYRALKAEEEAPRKCTEQMKAPARSATWSSTPRRASYFVRRR